MILQDCIGQKSILSAWQASSFDVTEYRKVIASNLMVLLGRKCGISRKERQEKGQDFKYRPPE
jgi:hypothetical protein